MWNKFVPGRETDKVSRAPGRLCSLWVAVKPESLNWAELRPDWAAPCTAVCPNPDEDQTTAVWESPSAAPQHSYQTLAAATELVANPHFHTDLKKESVHMVITTKLLQNLKSECHYVTFSFCLVGWLFFRILISRFKLDFESQIVNVVSYFWTPVITIFKHHGIIMYMSKIMIIY